MDDLRLKSGIKAPPDLKSVREKRVSKKKDDGG